MVEILLSMYDWKFTRLCCNSPSLALMFSECVGTASLLLCFRSSCLSSFLFSSKKLKNLCCRFLLTLIQKHWKTLKYHSFVFLRFFSSLQDAMKFNLAVYELRTRWITVRLLSFISISSNGNVASMNDLELVREKEGSEINYFKTKFPPKQ